jgi:spore coat polysaccharide biosynthesis protein SpsF
MRTRAGIIVQARVASTRLPGKALEPVGGRTILEQCLRRLTAGGVARVVLATTTRPEDDALIAIAQRLGVLVHRGSTDDVLGRFSGAALAYDLDPIVRATADNPAVDIQGPGRVLGALAASNADYVREEGLPYGAAVEGMTAAALHHAAQHADSADDREHVTTFIRRRTDIYRVLVQQAPAPLTRPSLRLTVDTYEDLQWVRELFFRVGNESPSLLDLIRASGRTPKQAVA